MRPDDDHTMDAGASGRDPLEPEELAAPPEPPEPEHVSGRPGPKAVQEQLREPVRLRETSVRRIAHRGEDLDAGDSAPIAESAATLGETLANERRRQGKTLADVEGNTRIRGRLIEALEHGEYDSLPSSAYVKGYIQSYAAFLELPAGPLIAQYNVETAGRAAKEDEHPYIKMPVAPALSGALPRRGSRDRRPSTFSLPGNMWVWVVVLIIVVVAIIGIARLLARSDQTVPPLPQGAGTSSTTATGLPAGVPATSSAGATSAAGAAGAGGATTIAGGIPAPPVGQFVVQVKTKKGPGTHVRIRSDGTIKFDQTMPGGQKQTTFAKDLVTVRAIDAAQLLSVTRNGVAVVIPAADAAGAVTVRVTKP